MDYITLTFTTPDRKITMDNVYSIYADGIDGRLAILPNHEPFITLLKTGVILIKIANTNEDPKKIIAFNPKLKISENNCVIVADEVYYLHELDYDTLQSRLIDITKLFDSASDEILKHSLNEELQAIKRMLEVMSS